MIVLIVMITTVAGMLALQEVAPAAADVLDKNLLIVTITLLAGIITTVLNLWKGAHDQRHQLELFQAQHLADRQDREAAAALAREDRLEIARMDKVEREEKAKELKTAVLLEAEAVRLRVDTSAKAVRDALQSSAESVRDRVDASASAVRDRLDITVNQAKADADRVVQSARVDAQATLDNQTAKLQDAIKIAADLTGLKADAAYHEANDVNTKIERLHEHNRVQAEALKNLLDVVNVQFKLDARPTKVEVVNVPLAVIAKPGEGV